MPASRVRRAPARLFPLPGRALAPCVLPSPALEPFALRLSAQALATSVMLILLTLRAQWHDLQTSRNASAHDCPRHPCIARHSDVCSHMRSEPIGEHCVILCLSLRWQACFMCIDYESDQPLTACVHKQLARAAPPGHRNQTCQTPNHCDVPAMAAILPKVRRPTHARAGAQFAYCVQTGPAVHKTLLPCAASRRVAPCRAAPYCHPTICAELSTCFDPTARRTLRSQALLPAFDRHACRGVASLRPA